MVRVEGTDMKLASWLIGISCAVGIVSADSKVFSPTAQDAACCMTGLFSSSEFRITAARRYAASSVAFKAFVQRTRIKGASRPENIHNSRCHEARIAVPL